MECAVPFYFFFWYVFAFTLSSSLSQPHTSTSLLHCKYSSSTLVFLLNSLLHSPGAHFYYATRSQEPDLSHTHAHSSTDIIPLLHLEHHVLALSNTMSFNKALNDEEVFSEMRKMVKQTTSDTLSHHLSERTTTQKKNPAVLEAKSTETHRISSSFFHAI